MPYRIAAVLLLAVSCLGRPSSRVPSTAVNLPIQDAIAQGETVSARISDTPKDYTSVEPTFGEQKLKNYIHQAVINFQRPTPIVDNLKEEDKYGNDGDRLKGVSNFIVRGTEVATRAVGGLVTVPRTALVTVSNKITQRLNGLGASLVGL